jgi:NADH-quinone oxidoreductase subunit G
MEEIPKTPQLVVSLRGAHSVIETFADRPLTGNYQGNLADVCPVGALTLKPFRFRARVWNLFKVASTCAECSRGCAITVEVLRRNEVKRFRPRYDDSVNGWWMCDTGRFALDQADLEGRLAGAVARGSRETSGWQTIDVAEALEWSANILSVHAEREMVLSPFMTVEEAESALALAAALGVTPIFVSPPPNDLKDDVLHTGDPCPNRRGLEDLGILGLDAEAIRTRLGECEAALLIGDRVGELLDPEALAALPAGLRLIVLDSRPLDVPATDLCVGIPCHVERTGTWVNIDGLRRTVGAARPLPAGTWLATRVLDAIRENLRARSAGARDEVAAR